MEQNQRGTKNPQKVLCIRFCSNRYKQVQAIIKKCGKKLFNSILRQLGKNLGT